MTLTCGTSGWTSRPRFIKIVGVGRIGMDGSGASKTVAGIDSKYYYLTLGLLALCAVAGMILIFRFQREVDEDDAPPTEKDLLGPLERAYYSGLMRDEEFERIQESMAKRKGEPPARGARSSKIRVKPSTVADPESAGNPADDSPRAITPTGDSDPGPSPG